MGLDVFIKSLSILHKFLFNSFFRSLMYSGYKLSIFLHWSNFYYKLVLGKSCLHCTTVSLIFRNYEGIIKLTYLIIIKKKRVRIMFFLKPCLTDFIYLASFLLYPWPFSVSFCELSVCFKIKRIGHKSYMKLFNHWIFPILMTKVSVIPAEYNNKNYELRVMGRPTKAIEREVLSTKKIIQWLKRRKEIKKKQ